MILRFFSLQQWRMNVGRGYITKEKWVSQDNEICLLEKDDVEIMEQCDPA